MGNAIYTIPIKESDREHDGIAFDESLNLLQVLARNYAASCKSLNNVWEYYLAMKLS